MTIKAPLYILQIVGKRKSSVLHDKEIHDLIASVYLDGVYMSNDFIDYLEERANGWKKIMTDSWKASKGC